MQTQHSSNKVTELSNKPLYFDFFLHHCWTSVFIFVLKVFCISSCCWLKDVKFTHKVATSWWKAAFFPHPEDLRRNSPPTGCSKLNEVCSSFAFRHISTSSAYLFVIVVQRILNRPAEVICQILQALFKWHKVEQTSTNIFALRCSVSWQFSQTLWSDKCYTSICWIQWNRTEQNVSITQ